MAFLNKAGLERLWAHIILKLNHKVDKIDGKSLSTNDFTNEDKEKLNSITQSDWAQTDETAMDFIKNKPYEETEDDALELLTEMGVLEATTNEEGFVLTDENNNILTI